MSTFCISHDSCLGGFRHGFETPCLHGFGCSGIAMAHSRGGRQGRQCTMRSASILLVALQLLFSRFISFRVIAYFFPPAHPLPVYTYITPGQYRMNVGVSLALKRPEYASCRPPFGLPSVVGSPKHCYSYSPCVVDHKHGPDVAHEALVDDLPIVIQN